MGEVLVVGAAARGHGVGGELLDAVERFATAQGCEAVLVATPAHRVDAQRFYARRGYEVTGPRLVKVIAAPTP